MFKNIYYNTVSSKIHLWEQTNGKDSYSVIPWVPYVFVKTNKSNIHTIDGAPVVKKSFKKYRDYYTYNKDNMAYENKCRPEIQFLAERYHHIPDDEMDVPVLKVYYLDIEIAYKDVFPSADTAKEPIVLISIRNNITDKTVTFGEKEYSGKSNIAYMHCPDEKELMRKFFAFMSKHPPDVISGWNVKEFDILYIINRAKNLFIKRSDIYQSISPIKIVRTYREKSGKENIDICGLSILDYMDIYKWYTPHNLESHSLDFVANFELGKGKLDYSEYKDLKDLYENNWNKYVDYNVRDCKRVHEIGMKCGYIKLIQALSLLTKAPMKYYSAMTQLIEGVMISYYRRNGLCAPYFAGGTQEEFEAAYVKYPIKGMHEWVSSMDITSSYPSHIIALNMSTETFVGRIAEISENQMIHYVQKKSFPEFNMIKHGKSTNFSGKKLKSFNQMLKKKFISIAPCGSVFSTHKPGVIATVERNIMFKRKEVKEKMKKLKRIVGALKDKEKKRTEEKINQLYDYQMSIKIILNAAFGITSVPYSRYFNTDIAKAITSCGRHTIKSGEVFINEILNDGSTFKDILGEINEQQRRK